MQQSVLCKSKIINTGVIDNWGRAQYLAASQAVIESAMAIDEVHGYTGGEKAMFIHGLQHLPRFIATNNNVLQR